MFKRLIAALSVAVVLILPLAGCGRYSSGYFGTLMVRNNTSGSAYLSFHTLEGTVVFRLECDGENAGGIKYSGELESGSVTVYYDSDGTRTELFSVESGGKADSTGGVIKKGTVYIIVVAEKGSTDGKFSFSLE